VPGQLHVRCKYWFHCTSLFIKFHSDWDWKHALIKWSTILFEKLIIAQLVKKFTTFYWTWRFNTVFTRTHHWALAWVKLIQSTPNSLRYILISFSHLHLGLFHSSFPTKMLYAFLIIPCMLQVLPFLLSQNSELLYISYSIWKFNRQ